MGDKYRAKKSGCGSGADREAKGLGGTIKA